MATRAADLSGLRVEVRFGAVALGRLVAAKAGHDHDDTILAKAGPRVGTPPAVTPVIPVSRGRRRAHAVTVLSGARHAAF